MDRSLENQIYTQMTTLDIPQIREAALAYFYNLAQCLQSDFAPYAEKMVLL